MRKIILLVAVIVAAGAMWYFVFYQPRFPGRPLGADAETVLRSADRFEFFTLNPGSEFRPYLPGERLEGFVILGQAEVASGAMRERLIEALNRSIEKGGYDYKCFQPRHAMRATWGNKSMTLVICFECNAMRAYGNAGARSGHIGEAGEQVFNDVAVELKLPLDRRK